MMKIAFLWYHFIQFGGVERVLTQKINLLAEREDYEVYLVTYNQGDHPFLFELSPRVRHVDLATRYFSRCSYRGLWQYADRWLSLRDYYRVLTQYFESLQPDVLVCVDHRATEMKAVLKSRIKGKKVVECHIGRLTEYMEMRQKSMLGKLKLYFRIRQRARVQKKLDVAVCLTQSDADDWKGTMKTVVIPNILSRYPETLTCRRATDFKHVISAGRLSYQKGFDRLIEAWRLVAERHPDWILDIFGAPDIRQGQVMSLKEDVHGVVFHPATNAIYSRYQESDFYVMSSRYESFGLVLTEAMSCGIPCVSFDCPYGPHDIIQDGVDGFLVRDGDIAGLADRICYMIEHRDERLAMGRKARENVKRFLPQNVMSQWFSFYDGLSHRAL